MKIFLDFLPLILFFGTLKYAGLHPDRAAQFATDHFGFLVSGGVVGVEEAPVLLATLAVILATTAQVLILLAMRRKIDLMLWITFVLVVTLGGATVWFHNPVFIKWKPTVLYWAMGVAFWVSHTFFRKNLLQTMMGDQLQLPAPIWFRLNLAWIAFFAVMGILNLYVAFHYSTETWGSFKAFGATGLMFIFMLAQGLYLGKHVLPDPETPAAAAAADAEPRA